MRIEKLPKARKLVILGVVGIWGIGVILHAMYLLLGWIEWDTFWISFAGLSSIFAPAFGLISGYYVRKRAQYNAALALASLIIIGISFLIVIVFFIQEMLHNIPIDRFFSTSEQLLTVFSIFPALGIGYLFSQDIVQDV